MEDREKRRQYREAQLQEQKRIDEAVELFRKSEKERAEKIAEAHLEHRRALDRDLEVRAKRQEELKKFGEYEEHKRKIFNDAKKVSRASFIHNQAAPTQNSLIILETYLAPNNSVALPNDSL